MSVIMESQPGQPIVIIGNFICCEYGIPFEWERATEFHVGDVVYFEAYYRDENAVQEYLAFMVKFKIGDGRAYSANQLFFATEYEWADIEDHFKR